MPHHTASSCMPEDMASFELDNVEQLTYGEAKRLRRLQNGASQAKRGKSGRRESNPHGLAASGF
jgi:hypothetical protein